MQNKTKDKNKKQLMLRPNNSLATKINTFNNFLKTTYQNISKCRWPVRWPKSVVRREAEACIIYSRRRRFPCFNEMQFNKPSCVGF